MFLFSVESTLIQYNLKNGGRKKNKINYNKMTQSQNSYAKNYDS